MILFVDDERWKMDSYRRELELSFSAEHEVCFTSRIDEALVFVTESRSRLDLLILDIMMNPGRAFRGSLDGGLKAGVHFYERVRKDLPYLPIIIFTNVTSEDVRKTFEDDERCRFLNKEDYFPHELADEVREMLLLSQ